MDWALDDILMGEFQIPPSPQIQISHESMLNSSDTNDGEIFSGNSGFDPHHTIHDNGSVSVSETTSASKPSDEQSHPGNDEPDYVSELHQLLAEDDSHIENNMLDFESTPNMSASNQSGIPASQNNQLELANTLKAGNENDIHAVPSISNRNLTIESSNLPLLLSPPPAYKDEIGDLSFIISPGHAMESQSAPRPTILDSNIHTELSSSHISLPKQPILGLNNSFNKTISVGDSFLTISPASVATNPLTSTAAFPSVSTKKHVPSLPFSVTRLPGGTILHSTTIKPAKSSSNSFSFLPITPVTASPISATTTTTNSPLLLKALTPTKTLDNSFVSSPLSITPIAAPLTSDSIDESGSQAKRFRSQSTLSFMHETIWKKKEDFKDVTESQLNGSHVLSAPASVETSCSDLHSNSKQLSNLSLPINSSEHDLGLSSRSQSLGFESLKPIISLPPSLISTIGNQPLSNDLKAQKLQKDENSEEKEQHYAAASKLAASFEALQSSATPQAGESSVDLMNALSLSILPVQEENTLHQTSAFRPVDPNTLIRQNVSYGPQVSSDLSLSSNKLMGTSNSTAIMSSNSASIKCPENILSGNNSDGSTISIRPIWKGGETTNSENNKSKTAWDSAVVAQLGTLTPCAPPPLTNQGAIKSSISKSISTTILPPPPKMTKVSIGSPLSKSCTNQTTASENISSPVAPIMYDSISLQNELASLSSSRQQLGPSSILLPPPPYPSSSSSLVVSKPSFSTTPQTLRVPTAMSEADSGVESIDSLSPKDVSPISSPSTSAGSHSESMISNSILPPPPVSFSSTTNNISIGSTNIAVRMPNLCSGPDDTDKIPIHQAYSDKLLKSLLDSNEINVDKPLARGSIENSYAKNSSSMNSSTTSKSVLSTLLSTVPKPTKSSELLSTLLNNQVSAPSSAAVQPVSVLPCSKDIVSYFSSSSNMSLPQTISPSVIIKKSPLKRSASVIAINPNDMILSKEEKNKAKFKGFAKESSSSDVLNELEEHMKLGGFSNDEANESNSTLMDEPILRSALEDMDTSISHQQPNIDFDSIPFSFMDKKKDLDITVHPMHVINNNKNAAPKLIVSDTQGPAQPSKQESFDCMIEQGQKLVSTWDADLHLRLKQLDSELDLAKHGNVEGLLGIKPDQQNQDNKTKSVSSVATEFKFDLELNQNQTIKNKSEGPKSSSNSSSPNNSGRTLLCPYCDDEFESNAARNDHKRKVHGRRNLCVPCDMVFASSTKLERHLLTHKGTKDHQCHICGKAFMIERNLILHQKLHLGQRDYVCDICGKSYFTKSGLQAHLKQNHSPPNESNCGDESYVEGSGFVCKDKKCEKRHFATRYDLEQHRKLDHRNDSNQETLKCVNCDATFKSTTQLKRHTANAHCSRPFKCPHCPHRSKNKVNLERHVAFHTSNKDAFQCLHCERKFAFKNSMKKHLEKGRCTVLKELEKAQKANNNGAEVFKNFLEATIMRHLQQTPKAPAIQPTPPPQPPSVSLQNNSSNNYLQPQLNTIGPSIYSIIQGNNINQDMITSMDTTPSSSYATINFTSPTSNLVSTLSSPTPPSSSVSSYINNTASAICSDRNLQSVMPILGNNENIVPNDILYQFDTSSSSCNSINN